ncbi:PQQ-dependent sugar dehydrogenase [Parvularcula sp. ZS-1/3]|uniref:PQQ-dependent sugar dehydrogenase n=1 Tax=Parvularcula mediterranea TaxID=2732508 RepID=A0A7Y3RKJ4_9PROT|nr:PQQ-dependent sugar dehydrogenase [Parvularcula mediterranea]NNU15763.1 PQQ-dependent sugar dehydrogenase [Parvularcula mediterranea]
MLLTLLASTALYAQEVPKGVPHPFDAETIVDLDHPWAMTFLPDGNMLVTEKDGRLLWVSADGGTTMEISGVPEVDFGGQGGLGDVILGPNFADDGMVYLSYVEKTRGRKRGAAVGRGTLDTSTGAISDFEVIWRQNPTTTGRGHYGHRLHFSPDGEYLFISSGDRQKFDPAQDMTMNLGKILRVFPDGSIPEDNPFYDQGGVTAEIWTIGMRNPLGIDFDAEGTLWEIEMGPRHGDEFQKIEKGENYGYPTVSNGDHYSGDPIPDHSEGDGFRAPDEYWVPAISPSSLLIYQGDEFPAWKGEALIGGLSSEALVKVTFDCAEEGRDICEEERYDMDYRVRGVVQGPDGLVYLIEDGGERGGEGRIIKLTPKD